MDFYRDVLADELINQHLSSYKISTFLSDVWLEEESLTKHGNLILECFNSKWDCPLGDDSFFKGNFFSPYKFKDWLNKAYNI